MDDSMFGNQLHSLLREVNLSLAKAVRYAFEPVGITRSQSVVLTAAQHRGGQMLLSELCEIMNTPASNVTNICNRLETGGYIEKQRGTGDRRKVMIKLTPKGETLVESIRMSHDKIVTILTENTPDADREVIIDGLTRLSVLLGRNVALLPQGRNDDAV